MRCMFLEHNMAAKPKLSVSEQKKEDWMNTKWRPVMGWMYMGVCLTDFVLFPILWSVLQAVSGGQVTSQWQPLTLQGAGLFHIAMGAVLGLAVYGRTQEKLNGATGTSTYESPYAPTPSPSYNNYNSRQNYNQPSATVTFGFGGKKAPVPADEPEL